MRLCFVADGRSPIARNWIRLFSGGPHDLHLISTYPCADLDLPGVTTTALPLPLAGLAGAQLGGPSSAGSGAVSPKLALRRLATRVLGVLGVEPAALWTGVLSPAGVVLRARQLRRRLRRLAPDLVHALRIPPEGELAALARPRRLALSVWGNDFTLKAREYPAHRRLVRTALKRAALLFPDCERDGRLARQLGLPASAAICAVPASGGIDTSVFHPAVPADDLRRELGIPPGAPVVFNPRGVRPYIRNDVFFAAIPRGLAQVPGVVFLGGGMAGNVEMARLAADAGVADSVRLLAYMPDAELATYFALADVAVSPAVHDGTPITLLEAMACGALPVVSDLESMREWIVDGENGLLCDPSEPADVADRIVCALRDQALRRRARERNQEIIAARADRNAIRRQVEPLYQDLASRSD